MLQSTTGHYCYVRASVMKCRNCDQEIVQVITIDGVGWFHVATHSAVYESCQLIGQPVAQPAEEGQWSAP